MRRRTAVVLAAAMSLAVAGLLTRPHAARAHGVLRSSTPASGARLAAVPRALRLTFNERVELAVARIELRGPDSALVALSPLRAGASPESIVADVVGPLTAGAYAVAWQVAGRDGHPVRGRIPFTIAAGAAGLADPATSDRLDAAATEPDAAAGAEHHEPAAVPTAVPTGAAFDAQSTGYAAIRWLAYGATLALFGAVAFSRAVVPGAARRGAPAAWAAAAERGARRVGTAAAAAVLAGALLRLAAQDVAVHGAANAGDPALVASMIAGTTWGMAWLVGVGAAGIALLGLLLARRAPALGWTAAGAGAAGCALSAALSGHAAAVPRATALAVTADAAHVLGAGGWLGTLLLVTLVAIPAALRLEAGQRGPAAAAAVRAFSPLALACAGAVALTGLASAWMHLESVRALWATAYGRTLLVKLAALSLVAATALYNWRRALPALGDETGARRLRRSAAVELAIGAAVLAVTAVLVATPTHDP